MTPFDQWLTTQPSGDDDYRDELVVAEPMHRADWCDSCERFTLPARDGSCSRCGQHCYP